MSYKIECKVIAIRHVGKDSLEVDIDPIARFRIMRLNPIKGNRPTEYALFIEYEYFGSSNGEMYKSALRRIDSGGICLRCAENKGGFDYAALAAAQATKGRARLMVNDDLVHIESVEMI